MSRATAMASRQREAEIAASTPASAAPPAKSRMGWGILAILAGVGAAIWIFSPGTTPAGPRSLPDPGPAGATPADHHEVTRHEAAGRAETTSDEES